MILEAEVEEMNNGIAKKTQKAPGYSFQSNLMNASKDSSLFNPLYNQTLVYGKI